MYNWIDRVMLWVENTAGWDVDLRVFISCVQAANNVAEKRSEKMKVE